MHRAQPFQLGVEDAVAELGAVICADPLELPAGVPELAGRTPRQGAREAHVGVPGHDVPLGPAERAGGVDRRMLPDDALGAGEAAAAEAVHLQQLAGVIDGAVVGVR